MKIPLFDIDLTLLKLKAGRNVHEDAFDYVFKTVYGINASIDEITPHGMIDPQIIREVLKLHQLTQDEIESRITEAMRVMVDYFVAHQKEVKYQLQKGVEEMLDSLEQKDIPKGLLTGNIETIAWLKLDSVGIRKYFQFGAFGNLVEKRVDLISVARKRAKEAGIDTSHHQLVIVGDSPLDITCAKEGKIGSVGIATGVYSMEQLTKAGADLVISSFEEKRKFINFLNL